MGTDAIRDLVANLREGKGTREEAATALESAAKTVTALRHNLERDEWGRLFAGAMSGYLSDASVDPGDPKERDALLRNCRELAEEGLAVWRKRWIPE